MVNCTALVQEQQYPIEYLKVENGVLREKVETKRILFNDDQRRRLAVKGKVLGRRALRSRATSVTPDTAVGSALREHGIEPAPKRGRTTTWKTFLKAH